jgi:ankyrin repeat protein
VSSRLRLWCRRTNLCSTFVKDFKLVKWLLGKGANPGVISPSGDTPLSFAVTLSSVNVIKLLISANKRYNQDLGTGELVHRAVKRCWKEQNLEILDTLVRAGAPVDGILWDQSPAYDTKAHFRRGTPLHEACKYGYPDVADMLITNGADPNKQKTQYRRPAGETPYEMAATKNDTAMLEVMQRHVPEPSLLYRLRHGTNFSASGSG